MLSRTLPGRDELVQSASSICSFNGSPDPRVQPLIRPLAEAFKEVYEHQPAGREDFYGLRDFYYLVKLLNSMLMANPLRDLTRSQIEFAIRTNFGGSQNVDEILEKFFEKVIVPDEDDFERPDVSPLGLVRASLSGNQRDTEGNVGPSRRYLLVMTKDYTGFRILFDHQILNEESTVVIFGSSFPEDQEYTQVFLLLGSLSSLFSLAFGPEKSKPLPFQVCRNINRIKVCMETGRTVILLNLKSLYASLYDMLNQYFLEFGGHRYVDLGLGMPLLSSIFSISLTLASVFFRITPNQMPCAPQIFPYCGCGYGGRVQKL